MLQDTNTEIQESSQILSMVFLKKKERKREGEGGLEEGRERRRKEGIISVLIIVKLRQYQRS